MAGHRQGMAVATFAAARAGFTLNITVQGETDVDLWAERYGDIVED
jgi:hypothetical protein